MSEECMAELSRSLHLELHEEPAGGSRDDFECLPTTLRDLLVDLWSHDVSIPVVSEIMDKLRAIRLWLSHQQIAIAPSPSGETGVLTAIVEYQKECQRLFGSERLASLTRCRSESGSTTSSWSIIELSNADGSPMVSPSRPTLAELVEAESEQSASLEEEEEVDHCPSKLTLADLTIIDAISVTLEYAGQDAAVNALRSLRPCPYRPALFVPPVTKSKSPLPVKPPQPAVSVSGRSTVVSHPLSGAERMAFCDFLALTDEFRSNLCAYLYHWLCPGDVVFCNPDVYRRLTSQRPRVLQELGPVNHSGLFVWLKGHPVLFTSLHGPCRPCSWQDVVRMQRRQVDFNKVFTRFDRLSCEQQKCLRDLFNKIVIQHASQSTDCSPTMQTGIATNYHATANIIFECLKDVRSRLPEAGLQFRSGFVDHLPFGFVTWQGLLAWDVWLPPAPHPLRTILDGKVLQV